MKIGVLCGDFGIRFEGNTDMGLAILRHGLVAWLIGLLVAGCVVMPFYMASAHVAGADGTAGPAQWFGHFLNSIPISIVAVAILGPVLSAPLFGIGMAVALLAPGWILRHPLFFAVLAPLLSMIFVTGWNAYSWNTGWARGMMFWEKFQKLLFGTDTLVFAIPVAVAAFYFCFWLRKRVSPHL
jgi:hypothetical protein